MNSNSADAGSDDARIAAIVRDHAGPVRRALEKHFGSSVSASDIDDAVQEGIARMWLRRRAYGGPEVNLRALLFVIARNILVSVLRRRGREVAALEDVLRQSKWAGSEAPGGGVPAPVKALLQDAVVNRLTAAEREVLDGWMTAPPGEDWTPHLSRRLDMSPGHLRVVLHRILSKLRAAVTAGVLQGERLQP